MTNSDGVTIEAPPLVIRERSLSDAASQHLLSKSGSSARLAAAMSSDVKRIRAGLRARRSVDALTVSPDGHVTVYENKRQARAKDGMVRVVLRYFSHDRKDRSGEQLD